jgi:hypothetical protein
MSNTGGLPVHNLAVLAQIDGENAVDRMASIVRNPDAMVAKEAHVGNRGGTGSESSGAQLLEQKPLGMVVHIFAVPTGTTTIVNSH